MNELLATVTTHECRVLRRKHRIGFIIGGETTTVRDLMDKLKLIPGHACVDFVECHEDVAPYIATITFHEEQMLDVDHH
jgi:hypothetical protein